MDIIDYRNVEVRQEDMFVLGDVTFTVQEGDFVYLIGKVEAARYNPSESNINSENNKQIFTKDYITTVNMTVSSLAKAYNVPPNLLSNNLEIGVETTPQWVAAQPTVIRLE